MAGSKERWLRKELETYVKERIPGGYCNWTKTHQ